METFSAKNIALPWLWTLSRILKKKGLFQTVYNMVTIETTQNPIKQQVTLETRTGKKI